MLETLSSARPARPLRLDMRATFLSFAVLGFFMGNWNSRIPAVKEQLGVEIGLWGVLLVGMGLGSFLAMPTTGLWLWRFPVRAVHRVCVSVVAALWVSIGWLDQWVHFAVAYALLGVAVGIWDVTLNTHASSLERETGRTFVPTCHGAWGLGLLTGALTGSLSAHLTLAPGLQFAALMPLAAAGALIATQWWRPNLPPEPPAPASATPGPDALWLVALLCLPAFCAIVSESVAVDWIALRLVDELSAPPAIGGVTFAMFAGLMTAGRLLGHDVVDRIGVTAAVRASGIMVAVGMALVALATATPVALLGAALWGLGLAVVVPAGISAAGKLGGRRAHHHISFVITSVYAGFLVAPPLMGWLGSELGLRSAFLALAPTGLVIALFASAFSPRRHG